MVYFWLWSHVKHDLSSRHYKCSQWKKPYWSCFHAFQEISKQFLLSLLFFTIISSENHVTRRKFGDKLLDGPDAVCNRTKCNYLKERAHMWIARLLQCNDFGHPVFGCGYDDTQCDQIHSVILISITQMSDICCRDNLDKGVKFVFIIEKGLGNRNTNRSLPFLRLKLWIDRLRFWAGTEEMD